MSYLAASSGAKAPLHLNDHVNTSQQSNDSFPTAMHIAAAQGILADLVPALSELLRLLGAQGKGLRQHRQDRPHAYARTQPRSRSGKNFSRYAAQVENAITRLGIIVKDLFPLAQGGTAVGTGLNSKPRFARLFAKHVAKLAGLPPNKFEALASHDANVFAHGAINAAATGLF
jgi:fumarate hydratase, class II